MIMTPRKAKKPETDLTQYYTAEQAAKKLSENSGRTEKNPVSPAYLRTMARAGLIEPLEVGTRMKLYPKAVIDTYIVKPRGGNLTSEARQQRKSSNEPAQ